MPSKAINRMLIANRGEIAIRVIQTAADLGITTVAVAPADDRSTLHTRRADSFALLPGAGPAAYLDGAAIIELALRHGCDAVHPGYGFLSENADFASACEAAGLIFIGPSPETLSLFGDKGRARALARTLGVPLAKGTEDATSVEQMRDFLASIPGRQAMIKAVSGGGGRGMRVISSASELPELAARASAEARAAFGSDALYIEEFISPARHVEVQLLGDADGTIVHLHDRECSLQRRNQKVVEFAPAFGISTELRDRIIAAALALAAAATVRTLCTFEFLVDMTSGEERFIFMEANPRLQVEHTITEEVTGIDLVQAQIQTAAGHSLAELGLTQDRIGAPKGLAVQLRINMETVATDGGATPASGSITAFDPPFGAGIRLETHGYTGYVASPRYDALLAKLVVSDQGTLARLCRRAERALSTFRIEGVATNIPLLMSLLGDPHVQRGAIDTRFIETKAQTLLARPVHARRFAEPGDAATRSEPEQLPAPSGTTAIHAPMSGVVVAFDVAVDEPVRKHQPIALLEAMKMQQVVLADRSGIVRAHAVPAGASVTEGAALVFVEEGDVGDGTILAAATADPDHVRADLAEVVALHQALSDSQRPAAVAARRKTNQRTARENIEDLCDPGSFVEYGALALAAQRRRRSMEELRALSPADGLIAGIGTINARRFGEVGGRAMVMAYDYTVFAGTQGFVNHKKMDRLLNLANGSSLPLVVFAEGGGGRPGDTDHMGVAGLDVPTFRLLGQLSGQAPSVAIVSGRCFAGNAAIAAGCDTIIATANATIGMGGPAMIEGGGLGQFRPEDVGPVSVQEPNGVLDIVVADEAAASDATKRYLAFFQGDDPDWTQEDQRLLRSVVPENRLRAYDIGEAIRLICDSGSLLELRPRFGLAMRTFLARIEGRSIGVIANDPRHLGGAMDGDAADKAARFLELCETYGLPIVSLCDTPGFMVGPDAEKTALVRRVGRMFLVAANISVPMFTVVLRKGYGLGAMGMAGGATSTPGFVISWPTGEFGGMGLEGAVQLGYRNELNTINDPTERKARYDQLLGELYQRGKATSMASFVEIDAVIDPVDTRAWLKRGLASFPVAAASTTKRRPFVTPR